MLNKVNNWIKSIGGFTVVSPVYAPVHYQLTPQQLKTIIGKNSITTNSYGCIDVEYWTHTSPSNNCRTVTFNQWCLPLNGNNWVRYNSNYIDVYYSYDTANVIWKRDYNAYNTSIKLRDSIQFTSGDKWYISYMLKPSVQSWWGYEVNSAGTGYSIEIAANIWKRISGVLTMNRTIDSNIYIPNVKNTVVIGMNCEIKAPILINLTQMYGAGNEPTTSAEFERQCELNGIDLCNFIEPDRDGTTINWYY